MSIKSFIKDTAVDIIKKTATGVVDENKSDLVKVLQDAVSDTVHSMIARKESVTTWAEIASKGIDPIIKRISDEQSLQYVGGKLIFSSSQKNSQKVDISFELYFVDSTKNWRKVCATSDVYNSVFTDEALEDLRDSGTIEYSIEG